VRGGAQGAMVTEAVLARYRGAVSDLRVVSFDESGHDLWQPDPTRFATTVASFLSDVDEAREVSR
jgi:hypothetical protein